MGKENCHDNLVTVCGQQDSYSNEFISFLCANHTGKKANVPNAPSDPDVC